MSKPLYITTTLPYVNAEPHIGFALELVHADIYARYRALLGNEVFFNTGTDEHGLKIFRKAQQEGKDTQAYVDEYAAKFRGLKEKLGLSSDIHFVRTTDPHHKKAAQHIWELCAANIGPDGPDIYKKKYKGLYCVGDEAFIKETELVNGKCPNHPTMDVIEIEEENYFFRLSRYAPELLKYLGKEGVVVPEWRRQEAINFVKAGLEDFSISRVKEKMPWGVPVPGDDTQIMYVWFDALTNYISTLGWPFDPAQGKPDLFEKFWTNGETLQLAGKDQVRFQSIMWQAMLMSAGIKTTDRVVYHGFITSGGQKMSKSLGNTIDPMALVDEYGTDALRFFLARHIHPFGDSDFTMERFKDAYNADLANGLGNLVARVMRMSSEYLQAPVDIFQTRDMPDVKNPVESFEYNRALDSLWSYISDLDELIQEGKPFEVAKTNRTAAEKQVKHLVTEVARIAKHLQWFMPQTAQSVLNAIQENKKPENLFPRKE